jgi:hypothetical protein
VYSEELQGDISQLQGDVSQMQGDVSQISNELTEKFQATEDTELSAGQSITLKPDDVIGKVTIDIKPNSMVTVIKNESIVANSFATQYQSVTEKISITENTTITCDKGTCTVKYDTTVNLGDLKNGLSVLDEEVDNLAEEVDYLASAIIPTVSGESITVNDSANRRIEGLELFGKTKQNGIPTPDSPLNFDNVGDSGSFNISVCGEQTLTIPTPNGLMGVKATGDGNYTDDNGQQWMCDVIDYERGKYIQNVKIANAKDLTWGYSSTGFFYVSLTKCNLALCTHYLNIGIMTDTEALDKADKTMSTFKNLSGIRVMDTRYTNVNDFISSMGDMKILYALPNPIERDLTEAEMVDYTQVHTNYPDTTITNDADAGMEFKYVADTKLYIDNKFAELQNAVLSMGANI